MWPLLITKKNFCAGGIAYSNAHFGAGSGPIFLDDVQCTSASSQLLECPSRPILSHNCLHSADAGVACEGMLILSFKYISDMCLNWCTSDMLYYNMSYSLTFIIIAASISSLKFYTCITIWYRVTVNNVPHSCTENAVRGTESTQCKLRNSSYYYWPWCLASLNSGTCRECP